jgi:hypothetical protein
VRYRGFATTRTSRRILTAVLPALLAGVGLALSAVPASADPLPTLLPFEISNASLGGCASVQSAAPHYVRTAPCSLLSILNPAEAWTFNPGTGHVTSAATGDELCLDFNPGPPAANSLRLVMTPCGNGNFDQRWEEVTDSHGKHYMAWADNPGVVVTALPHTPGVDPAGDWIVDDLGVSGIQPGWQQMTFPLLSLSL